MTPELKIACEVVFQEHKLAGHPVKWGRDAFRGRISIGLCEMAKETLVKKHIIVLPDKSKKIFTQLNPEIASAVTFEEAEKMIGIKSPGQVLAATYNAEAYINDHVYGFAAVSPVKKIKFETVVEPSQPEFQPAQAVEVKRAPEIKDEIKNEIKEPATVEVAFTEPTRIEPVHIASVTSASAAINLQHHGAISWHMKPLFLYFIWPILGAAAGIVIARLMDMVYTDLFLHVK